MAVKIDTIMLRYFVPFGFNCENDAMFSESVRKIRNNAGTAPVRKAVEDDFFSSISELYSENNPSGIGEYIEYSENLPKLLSKDEKYTADFTRCGIYLNRNGLGIIWYEVKPDKDIIGDVHTLYSFQNSFKELTVHKNSFMWQRTSHKKCEFNSESGEKRIVTDKNEIRAIAQDAGLDMDGKYPVKAVVLENGRTILEYSERSEFHQGLWINEILSELNGLHFMPQRYKGEERTPIPDKALLCSYTLFSADTDDERMDYMFRMTSGYSESYKRSENIDDSCLKPFNNTWWYAKQEGIGQYVLLDNNEKRTAFHRDLAVKRMENYCYLYVLVLQQHYSLLEYSERIGKLSAPVDEKDSKKHLKALHRCVDDMNVFFMKNTFPGISHITHQNDVYKYLRDIYDIKEFYAETKNGLEAVTEMVEKYRGERNSDRLFLCTITGAVFVIAETLVNLTELASLINIGEKGSLAWWISVAVLMGASLFAAFIVWIIWKRWKK